MESAKLTFWTNASIYFAFHEPEQEFWLSEGLMPTAIKLFKFSPKSGKLAAGDVHIVKRVTTVLGSKGSPCQTYESNNGFTQCVKRKVQNFAENKVSCVTPYTKHYFGANTSLPWCSKEVYLSSIGTFTRMLLDLGKSPEKYGCMRSCKETAYDASVTFYHENTGFWAYKHTLYFSYNTLDVENKEERLLYDFPNLVSAIGGSMGLFLGLSLVHILQKTLQECNKKNFFPLA